MKYLLAVDPGKSHLAFAVFEEGALIRCGLLTGGSPLASAKMLRQQYTGPVHELLTEGQQIYGGRIRSDPNDLLPLAECVGCVKALMAEPVTEIIHPLPVQWKGSIKKEICTARIKAVLASRPSDLAVYKNDVAGIPKSLHHNVLDAIGLAYWRMKLVGVGATR